MRDTQRLFADDGRPGGGGVRLAEAPASETSVKPTLARLFDVGAVLDKVGDTLKSLVSQIFGEFDLSRVLEGLQDQVKNILSAPFDGRAGNLAVAGASFVSFQGVEISFESDGSHTSLSIKQTSLEAAHGFGATADRSLAYRLGTLSAESNELEIDIYAQGDEASVSALFKHTSLDIVAVEAIRRGPVELPALVGKQLPANAAPPAQDNRRSLIDRFLDLFGDNGRGRGRALGRADGRDGN
ncbi:MAG: hypothetical protein FJX52_10465, partial [Alphaproteobacteria bacterium]|nr:hypothetical protein [Alphaproteobacteria bacterium]